MMIYTSAQDWLDAPRKRVLFYGMSGLGKTFLSNMLRAQGGWFHYSIDYRIGTRYMGEYIADNAKAEAMKVPFLRDLLLSDSIYIGSNIAFNNLSPVSTYLGKPGNPDLGGLPIGEYRRRQAQFRAAEVAALMDTGYFIDRAGALYGYPHFICDTGGSICEWADGNDPDDPILRELSRHCLMIYIQGNDSHTGELVRRFHRDPKPMAYMPEFLDAVWARYLDEQVLQPDQVNPDGFIRWTYAQALAHRAPRYEAMAPWGITVTADEVMAVRTPDDFEQLVARALAARAAAPI